MGVVTPLRLAATGCGHAGAISLAELAGVHLRLRVLELARNPSLSDRGCSALAPCLLSSHALQTLLLGRCAIGDAGTRALAASLVARPASGLTALDLSFNSSAPNPVPQPHAQPQPNIAHSGFTHHSGLLDGCTLA